MQFELRAALAAAAACGYLLLAGAQTHQHDAAGPPAVQADARILVKFREPMRLHTITSMRDHLLALQEINVALSRNEFDKAASIAETRLGMSSLERHGASHIAPFMPRAMQEIGTNMHHAASRFALEAKCERHQRRTARARCARIRDAAMCGVSRRISVALNQL